jgi:hypothetical protein
LNQLGTTQTPAELTSDFLYLLFIKYRNIDENGKIQKAWTKELKMWADITDRVKNKAKLAIVAANNHNTGFSTATANPFRKMIGLKEVVGAK